MRKLLAIPVFAMLVSCSTTSSQKEENRDLYSKDFITSQMKKVADWQLAHPVDINVRNENDWARAAFYTGVMATYKTTGDEKYLNEAIRWSESFNYNLAERLRHADDHAKGQTYLEIYEVKKDPAMIADIRDTFDSLVLDPKPGRADWWWCDALFMAPPVMTKLAAATGEKEYLDLLHDMYWDAYEFLYDKEEDLFFRDESYFDKRTPAGNKTFWARGNGWVMAGIARLLPYLPKEDEHRDRYVDLLRKMSASVKRVQQDDGLWRPSLLDPDEVPHPETSGSAFFCFALAWGVNNGYLDRDEYLPVIRKAWSGLNDNVTEEGMLEWVQPIGASPDKVVKSNFQEYGSGAYLLAASEIYKLGS
jgi:Predicted unsaturated glucuronyl hydrolase involved in regulation of bacterial surface properties, and related proteins